MTDCTQGSFDFPALKKHVVEVNFEGGDLPSEGGVMLLRQADRLIGRLHCRYRAEPAALCLDCVALTAQ